MEQGPQRRVAQCNCIGCIGLRPALASRFFDSYTYDQRRVFCAAQGLSVLDFFPIGETVNSEAHTAPLKNLLEQEFEKEDQNWKWTKFSSTSQNATTREVSTRKSITSLDVQLRLIFLRHLQTNIFGVTSNESLKGKHFGNNEEMRPPVKIWLREKTPEFY